MNVFQKIDNIDFDFMQLKRDVINTWNKIKKESEGEHYHPLSDRNISLTASTPGSSDWTDGTAGKTNINNARGMNSLLTAKNDDNDELKDEANFKYIINQIAGTYLAEFIVSFPDVCRWRISILPPRMTLSIHRDGSSIMSDAISRPYPWRIHFPIQTNNRCFMAHWPDDLTTPKEEGEDLGVMFAHYRAGNAYLLNTTVVHCATNYSDKYRIHLIGSMSDETKLKLFS